MASEKWIVCRICLQQPNEKMECIFDVDPKKDMTQIILDCGGVPIKQFDHYPDKICSKCLKHLRIAHKFRETCRRSYNHLSRFIAPIEIESGDKSADEQQPELIVPSDDTALALAEEENNQATEQATSIDMASEQQYVVQLRADDGVVIDAVVGDYGGNVKEEYDEDLEGAEIVDEVTEDVVDIYAPMDDDNFEEIDDFEPVNREDQNIAEVVEYLDDIGAGLTSDEEYSPKISANARKVQRGRGRPPKTETQTKKLALHASSGKGIEGLMELRREKLKRYPRFKDKDGKLKTFICDVCGNIYPTQGRLKEHIKSHNGVKPHECEICGHAFAQNQQLARHMNTHTGNRPYKCNYCPSAFADLSTRNKHHRIHTNERPYACDVCGKAFAYTNTLKFHKMIHTGEKPFVCEICGKGFHQAYKLRNHKVTHEKRGIKIEKYDTDSVIEIYQEVSDATDVILKTTNC